MPTVARKWQERPTAIIAESTLTMQKGRQASAAQEAEPPRTSKVIEVRLAKSFGKKKFLVHHLKLDFIFWNLFRNLVLVLYYSYLLPLSILKYKEEPTLKLFSYCHIRHRNESKYQNTAFLLVVLHTWIHFCTLTG